MSRFETSWALFRRSMSVIGRNKKLLIFPIFITALTLVIMLFFIVPLAFAPTGHEVNTVAHWKALYNNAVITDADGEPVGLQPIYYGYAVAIYFASIFLATFFNVAFYSQIMEALRGQCVSVGRGLKVAFGKLGPIFMWSLMSGIVGLLIKRLEERFGFVGKLVIRLIGMAWSIACVFVIPVIVLEKETSSPVQFLKKSAITLKNTWGESLVGYMGVQFGGAIVFFLCLAASGAGVYFGVTLHNVWIAASAVAVSVVVLICFFYVLNIASQIYLCALYLYASGGTPPEPYNVELMNAAWKTKK